MRRSQDKLDKKLNDTVESLKAKEKKMEVLKKQKKTAFGTGRLTAAQAGEVRTYS